VLCEDEGEAVVPGGGAGAAARERRRGSEMVSREMVLDGGEQTLERSNAKGSN